MTDFMPGYVDPARRSRSANFSLDKLESEFFDLPRQLSRFGKNAYTGVTHLPYDIASLPDMLNMGVNAVSGSNLKTDYRSQAIQEMEALGLAMPEPTGADLPGYLFGGAFAPLGTNKAYRAAEGVEQAVRTGADNLMQPSVGHIGRQTGSFSPTKPAAYASQSPKVGKSIDLPTDLLDLMKTEQELLGKPNLKGPSGKQR